VTDVRDTIQGARAPHQRSLLHT